MRKSKINLCKIKINNFIFILFISKNKKKFLHILLFEFWEKNKHLKNYTRTF